jgi:hypothetical protein
MHENQVQHKCQKGLGLNKRKEFEFEIQTLQHLKYKPNLQGFHSSFENT